VTYHGAKLPPPPYTLILDIQTTSKSRCQEVIGWFAEDGRSTELRLVGGDLLFGENDAEWKQVTTDKLALNRGEWQRIAIQREVSGIVQIFAGGKLKARGRVDAHAPRGLSTDPRSSRFNGKESDCFLHGKVQDLSIFNFLVKPEVLAEIAM